MIGPIFARELVVLPRRARIFAMRSVYVAVLLLFIWTAWLVLAGTQLQMSLGDSARFGAALFQMLSGLQLALVMFFSALMVTNAVSQEKDRKTLILLLLTSLRNREIVLGKLFASLLTVVMLIVSAAPVFLICRLFGGVSLEQVGRVFLVTLAAAFAAGSLGSTMALWREKTFQSLAMVFLCIVIWLGLGELCLLLPISEKGAVAVASAISPWRALQAAVQPEIAGEMLLGVRAEWWFAAQALVLVAALNLAAMIYVRRWNGAEQARLQREEPRAVGAIWSDEHAVAVEGAAAKEFAARNVHAAPGKRRVVWDNPILWREVRTWAYGKKVLIIKALYLAVAVACFAALVQLIGGERGLTRAAGSAALAPLGLLGMVLVNALAVTSITNERDAKALDILLVTDLTPKEFVFGKLLGVFYNTMETLIVPLLIGAYTWWSGSVSGPHVGYVLLGLLIIYLFSATVGLHTGMNYVSSRNAVLVSQGVIFFLLVGVAMVMQIMISFRGSFQIQLQPFMALILGGFIGLYVALGLRNPSPAIAIGSLITPFLTFFAIGGFVQGFTLGVLAPIAAAYTFFVAALMVPALNEFDIATSRGGDAE